MAYGRKGRRKLKMESRAGLRLNRKRIKNIMLKPTWEGGKEGKMENFRIIIIKRGK